MATVIEEIRRCDSAISKNISELSTDRGLMSVNIINNARNLINHVALLIHTNNINTDSKYDGPNGIEAAMRTVNTRSDLTFLRIFYKQTQVSASHYTPSEDGAERLMLKYYEVLIKMRSYLQDKFSIAILSSLDDFPLDTDESQQQYYSSIVTEIKAQEENPAESIKDNCYIHRVKPFFVDGKVYYEVVFSPAIDRDNKFSHRIAFCNERVFDNYATDLWLIKSYIEVDGIEVPIEIIQSWKTNIRPCEFDNLGKIIGFQVKANRGQKDYLPIMKYISDYHTSIVEIIDFDDHLFRAFIKKVKPVGYKSTIVDFIQLLRAYRGIGKNTLRYLSLNMKNSTIKDQYPDSTEDSLSGVFLSKKTYPFELMPFCTSLKNHNVHLYDVIASIPLEGREHELIAKRILTNTEQLNMLYTPEDDIAYFGNPDQLVDEYNSKIYSGHSNRKIIKHDGYYFIKGYEDDVKEIVQTLKQRCNTGIPNYSNAVAYWLCQKDRNIDDPTKRDALLQLFDSSSVAAVYGAAGTGKTKMIEHISSYFAAEDKLYLANTKTAVSNLENRLRGAGEFMTVAKAIQNKNRHCSVLFIDECSTIDNRDMVSVLKKISFDYIVLVGDVYQIQSIRFGNWFNIIRKFLPNQSIFELKGTFRTEDDNLLKLWAEVRGDGELTAEIIERQGFARKLDNEIFHTLSNEEIILCLNYDGLYGVNNINRLLQSKNVNKEFIWAGVTYKVGDPITFSQSDAYGTLLFNNLKGKIIDIKLINQTSIDFTIELIGAELSQIETEIAGLEYISNSIIKMRINKRQHNDSDDSSEDARTVVPFQIAYAATIHKAQGLEYESVKIVVTRDSEERVTKNIFYTAITRTKSKLSIFWSPEVQNNILSSFCGLRQDNDSNIFLARNHYLLQ